MKLKTEYAIEMKYHGYSNVEICKNLIRKGVELEIAIVNSPVFDGAIIMWRDHLAAIIHDISELTKG